jgi:hypothetical protein
MVGGTKTGLALKATATDEHLKGAVNILANLVRSAHLKRALTRIEPEPALNFWRVIYGNLLDMAVIEWCKLFGSDNENYQQVHWKNMFQDESAFRDGLYRHLGISASAFLAYWEELKTYRDTAAAHLDLIKPRLPFYPTLDHAIASSYYYYAQLLPVLRDRGMTRYPDDLQAYGEAFLVQTVDIASKAMMATKNIHERLG